MMPSDRDTRRNRTLRRVLRLALRLQGTAQRPSLDTLAIEFRVSERTVRRDLLALHEAGWPVPSQWSEGVRLYDRRTSGVGSQGPRHPWQRHRGQQEGRTF